MTATVARHPANHRREVDVGEVVADSGIERGAYQTARFLPLIQGAFIASL
jgi:hypothetical protein